MLELYRRLSTVDPDARNAVLTVVDGADFGDEPSGPDAPDDEPSADDGAQADPPENEKTPPPKNRRGGGSVRKGSKGSDRQGERKRPADATSRMTYSTR